MISDSLQQQFFIELTVCHLPSSLFQYGTFSIKAYCAYFSVKIYVFEFPDSRLNKDWIKGLSLLSAAWLVTFVPALTGCCRKATYVLRENLLCIVETIPAILGSILRPVNEHRSHQGQFLSLLAHSLKVSLSHSSSTCDAEEDQITLHSQNASQLTEEVY